MKPLRSLSARPEVVLPGPIEPQTHNVVGFPAPLGRGRVLSALAESRPVLLEPPSAIQSPDLFLIADPMDGSVVGERAALWVHRMLSAVKTIDTRRL